MTTLTLPQVAIAITANYAFGFAILAVLALKPNRRAAAWDFAKTLGSALGLIGLLAIVFALGKPALIVVMPALIARISFEAASVRLTDTRAAQIYAAVAGLFALAAMLASPLALAFAGIWFLCLGRLTLPSNSAQPVWDLAVFPILPALLLTSGTIQPHLAPLLLATYLMVEIFDSFALFFGAMLGRTKAFPNLSPNKTVEGLLGGTAALLGLSLITAAFLGLPLLSTAGLALYVGIMSVVGDLAASRHKRIAGVKDYPQVLPRQGGLLDSLDSWIAVGGGLVAIDMLTRLW